MYTADSRLRAIRHETHCGIELGVLSWCRAGGVSVRRTGTRAALVLAGLRDGARSATARHGQVGMQAQPTRQHHLRQRRRSEVLLRGGAMAMRPGTGWPGVCATSAPETQRLTRPSRSNPGDDGPEQPNALCSPKIGRQRPFWVRVGHSPEVTRPPVGPRGWLGKPSCWLSNSPGLHGAAR